MMSSFRRPVRRAAGALACFLLAGGLVPALAQEASTIAGQGNSISVSVEGTLIVGAHESNSGQGAAIIFKRKDTGAWKQVASFAGSATPYAEFGKSVSIASTGTRAIIGSPSHFSSGVGAAFIYELAGGTWKKDTTLKVEGTEVQFGEGVFISPDGSTAFVGGPRDNGGMGAVWVYTKKDDKWRLQQKLVPSDGVSPTGFGESMASTTTGDRLVVGAPWDSMKGATWIFERTNGKWAQVGKKIVPAADAGAGYGVRVAMNAAGDIFVAGAPSDNAKKGAAYVFQRKATGKWAQRNKFTDPNGTEYSSFGWAVAISGRGGVIAVSEPEYKSGDNSGRVFTYAGTDTVDYAPRAGTAPTANPCQRMGMSLALAPVGNMLYVGSPATVVDGVMKGATCGYEYVSGTGWKLTPNKPISGN